jgi:hypothetical protein
LTVFPFRDIYKDDDSASSPMRVTIMLVGLGGITVQGTLHCSTNTSHTDLQRNIKNNIPLVYVTGSKRPWSITKNTAGILI